MEKHSGSIDLSFKGMPLIQLESFIPNYKTGILERLSIATRRRRFTLQEDWHIELKNIAYESDLNGTIVIPKEDDEGRVNIFDGASIPAPWLISLLTIGILRPLGVTLIGSIVHDYAYTFGNLKVLNSDGRPGFVKLERHKADKLFRDIISTANRLPPVGYIAWLAVRIGWIWVPYHKERYTGRKPYSEYLFVIICFVSIYMVTKLVPLSTLGFWLLGIYFIFWLTSLLLQSRYKKI